MTKGFVLIAHDTNEYSYGNLSSLCARIIQKQSKYPISLITDHNTKYDDNVFDKVLFTDTTFNQRYDISLNSKIDWKNTSRSLAYELSPYDQTILIDSDYLMLNNNLEKLFDQTTDFLCHNSYIDVSNEEYFQNSNWMGSAYIPNCWATVMYYKKSRYAELIFAMWRHVQDNYIYYCGIYNIPNIPYRNDYALSIATHMLNGQIVHKKFIPWQLNHVPLQAKVITTKRGLILTYNKYDAKLEVNVDKAFLLSNSNLHFLDKKNFESVANELLV